MIPSHIRLMGAMVYRTREALNGNRQFMNALDSYPWANKCIDGGFKLWHIPDTPGKISEMLRTIKGSDYKFPALLNFQQTRQTVDNSGRDISYNLAFVALTRSEWPAGERDRYVFDLLLRPLRDELINQIRLSGYFTDAFETNRLRYVEYEVFTTGQDKSQTLLDRYGDYLDALELHDLTLSLRGDLCRQDIERIDVENDLITENINC